ncbi:MAG: hypothetical protein ACFNUU_05890 [Campylobacter sp.]|uniref:hypothetical protein n=1 Tax=Campylobacter sp. TaxID=205 RepID=UPI00361FEE53
MLFPKFDRFLRINLARSWRYFAVCGLYGYLYGVNLLNFASAQVSSSGLKSLLALFCACGQIYAPARVLPRSNLHGVNFYEFTKTLEKN